MARVKKKKQGPDLDKYLEGHRKRYATYTQAAKLYSIPYYAFVKLAKETKSTYKMRKSVIVDLDRFESYLETKKEN